MPEQATPESSEDPRDYEPPTAEKLPARDGTVETAGGAITGGDD